LSSIDILRRIAMKLLEDPMVLDVKFLRTKVRAILMGEFVLDIYYNAATGRYSFTLLRGSRRLMTWDNAPHHITIPTFPHHFHDVDGRIKPSDLSGDPFIDIGKVLTKIRHFIGQA